MKTKCLLIYACLLSAFVLTEPISVAAQSLADENLHVVRSTVNAETENAELCLEFDKPLASGLLAHTQGPSFHLTKDGVTFVPQNSEATSSSLCFFPLDRGHPYQLTLNSLRGQQNERLASPYTFSFTVPNRSPQLAFIGSNGGVNGFGTYENPMALRAINVAHAHISVYRVTDVPTMAHIWQDRAQTTLAPSESVTLARGSGQAVWDTHLVFTAALNSDGKEQLRLRDQIPALAPGLYLIVAEAEDADGALPASRGLAPLAAAWFTKSDFSLRAVRDGDGIHVLASMASAAKNNVRLIALGKQLTSIAEAHTGTDGISFMPLPNDQIGNAQTLIALDDAGNVGFADIEALPALTSIPALGSIAIAAPFTAPGGTVDVSLAQSLPHSTDPTLLRVMSKQSVYSDVHVPALAKDIGALSFTAPALQGLWHLRWQTSSDAELAEARLRVTANADAPHLDMTTEADFLNGQSSPVLTIHALTSMGKATPLTAGHIVAVWQSRDPGAAWKNYRFGVEGAIINAPVDSGDFVTDLAGAAQTRMTLPKPPPEPGLYQAMLIASAEPDQGILNAPPLILPLRADIAAVGIKPLAVAEAGVKTHFLQNSLARFALIALAADGTGMDEKPRDMANLTYQVYEEGRGFHWYQDDGHWSYKREPQLRPIGGGTLAIRADGSSILEWPVTAGNYRLEIRDAGSKLLAQIAFSAGWDSANATIESMPLATVFPAMLEAGHEAVAHFTLPFPAMVSAIVADTRIRKTVHEYRPKGENTISFTPGADWQNGASLTLEATDAVSGQATVSLRSVVQAPLAHQAATVPISATGGLSLLMPTSGLALAAGGQATWTVGLVNESTSAQNVDYIFTAQPGLHIESGDRGHVSIGGRQTVGISVLVTGNLNGVHDLRLDIAGGRDSARTIHIDHTWPVTVRDPRLFMKSGQTITVAAQQLLIPTSLRAHAASDGAIAFIARPSMEGLGETLSYLLQAHPFTTSELALGIKALHLWQTPLAQDTTIGLERQKWLMQLLQHQNSDGGFAALRGGDSTMLDTAAALTALVSEGSDLVRPAKSLATAWLTQRLSNTWFDEKERAARAAAYAALAAADAIDPASLHYFSDISAAAHLPAEAEANIAGAFKHMRDPNAAAFWIKKMLDENGSSHDISTLNALAATDALSSDDANAALNAIGEGLRRGIAPDFGDAAALLHVVAANAANAGTWRITTGNQTRDVSGVYAVRLSDPVVATLRNGGPQNMTVSLAVESKLILAETASVTRHVYHLNGVELTPQTRPVHGEIYLVELDGKVPTAPPGASVLIQDSADTAIRPIGCMLKPGRDALAFIPWFTLHDVAPTASCEKRDYEISAALVPADDESKPFKVAYFAHLDVKTIAALSPPQIRCIK